MAQEPITTNQMALLFGGPSSRIASDSRCVIFDAVEREESTFTSKVAKHPIQVGSKVTDHVSLENDEYSFTVYVSNEPILIDKRNLILYGSEFVNTAVSGEEFQSTQTYSTYRSKYAHDLLKTLRDNKELITINVAHDTIPNCVIDKLTIIESSSNHLKAEINVTRLHFILDDVTYVKSDKKADAKGKTDKGKTNAGIGDDDKKDDGPRLVKNAKSRFNQLKSTSSEQRAKDEIPSDYE